MEVQSGTRPSRARLSDVSLQGAFVDTIVTFDVGAVVRLHFGLPSLVMSVEAEVVNVIPNMGMGVRFRNVTPAQRVALEELIGVDAP